MADYSAQAASLPPPQAAGANVVQPVETQATKSPILSILDEFADVIGKGLKNKSKDEAEARKNAVVGQYVKEQTLINDAITQGLPADQAGARQRASANKFLASYPEYYKEFKSAQDTIKGITEQGEAEDKVKQENQFYKERVTRAQSAGYSIDTTAPKAVQDLQLKAYDTVVRADKELSDKYKANAERRSQSAEDRQVFDRELKDTSIKVINEIAGTRLESTGAFITNVATDVRGGKLTAEQGNLKIANEFAAIYATLQSAASTSPELAAPYRTLFDQLHKVGVDMLDPNKSIQEQENQIKEIINRQKLFILADPQAAGVVAASQLLGANAQIALSAGNKITPIIAKMIGTNVGSKDFVPQVVGVPGVEKDVTSFLSSSLQKLNSGAYKDGEKAKTELTNSINQVLVQTGQALNSGNTDATKLKDLATFFASPEYGGFAKSGLLAKQATSAANKTFQLVYEPTVIKGIQQKLDSFLMGQASFGQKQGEPVPLSSTVDVKFTGSGIVFEPKASVGLDPMEQQDAARGVKDLASTQAAINQLIHIGAHLEGTTDYGKYWEDRKHVFLPQIFPEPAKLKVGDVIDGYKFLGGAYDNPRSWKPAK